jgi:hypothetical protein
VNSSKRPDAALERDCSVLAGELNGTAGQADEARWPVPHVVWAWLLIRCCSICRIRSWVV